MKNKTFFLFIFIFFLYSISYVNALNNPLLGKKIFLDPGHGGKDPGAINKNIMEKDLNLILTLKLKNKLENRGAIVYLTRSNDKPLDKNKKIDLYKRTKLINNSDADFYLSIHLNADKNKNYHGSQVFFNKINKQNENAAKIFQNLFKSKLHSKREYKEIRDRYIYRRVKKPGLLLELGFITNSNDIYLLRQINYQDKITEVIIEGINVYFKQL